MSQFGFSFNPIKAVSDAAKWTAKAAETVGKGVYDIHAIPTKAGAELVGEAAGAVKKVSDQILKIPVLGSIYGVYTNVRLFNAIYDIANGERIDKSAIGVIKNNVKDYKDFAPYFASVVAVVPGVGPGIGAGIAAGAALAEGQPLSQVAIAAGRGAIPGGAIAQAAYSIAVSAAQGKPIDQIAISALPISEKQKQLVQTGVNLSKDLAEGKRVDDALMARTNDLIGMLPIGAKEKEAVKMGVAVTKDIAAGKKVDQALINQVDNAMKIVSPEISKALNIGTAMGVASKMQNEIADQITTVGAKTVIAGIGKDLSLTNELAKAARGLNNDPRYQQGFDLAMGLLHGKKGNQTMITALRNSLGSEEEIKGFNAATALRIGKIEIDQLRQPQLGKISPAKIALRGALGITPPKKALRTSGDMSSKVLYVKWQSALKRNMPDASVLEQKYNEALAKEKVVNINSVKPKKPKVKKTPAQKAGFYITNGLVGAAEPQKVNVMTTVAAVPQAREGAVDAIKAIAVSRKGSETLWETIKRILFGS